MNWVFIGYGILFCMFTSKPPKMNNNNKLIYFLVFVLALIFGLIFFFVLKGCSEKGSCKVLNITVFSDHPLPKDSNGNMSDQVDVFCDTYEGEGSMTYISKVNFSRLDDGNEAENLIRFSDDISDSMDPKEAKIMFDAERDELNQTSLMNKGLGSTKENINPLTDGIRHYFLVSEGSNKIDGELYFDNVSDILNHMRSGLRDNSLFDGKKDLMVHVFILSDFHSGGDIGSTDGNGGGGVVGSENENGSGVLDGGGDGGVPAGGSSDVSSGGATGGAGGDGGVAAGAGGDGGAGNAGGGAPPPVPPVIESRPITLNYNLIRVDPENNNKISWNSQIADNSDMIKIRYVFKFEDKSVAKEFDVTGTSNYTLNMQNARYSAIPTDVTLIVTTNSLKVKLIGSNKLSNELFNCSAN